MKNIDDTATKKMEKLLNIIADAENFGTPNSELSVDELDKVTGGIAVPDYQQFLEYAKSRKNKETQSK